MLPFPDLLNAEPTPPVDYSDLLQSTSFGLAGGEMDSVFERVARKAQLAPSRFRGDCFARDLFLDDLVGRCLGFRIAGVRYQPHPEYLSRVIATPPADDRVRQFRCLVLEELVADKRLRTNFEGLYALLQQLRTTIATPDFGRQSAGVRRRLDILRAYRQVVDMLASGFEDAKSGISRLNEVGRAYAQSEVFRRICELLDQEENLAEVSRSLRLGYDGGVRSVALVHLEENHGGRYYRSPIARLFFRLYMALRGYRFSEDEALVRLIDGASAGFEDQLVRLIPLCFELEVYLSSLGFKKQAEAHGLRVSLADVVGERPLGEGQLGKGQGATDHQLRGLFNPLLFLQDITPVTCDVGPEQGARLIVITGPNSGGKTRLLQALALCQLLGQNGLFVPAAKAVVPRLDGLFVSLTEAATVDQKEGRLGTELLRIRRVFERASFNSLIILDELCSGTNPSEGEEIIELVLSLLLELCPRAFLTTHFLKFAKTLAERKPMDELEFWQVELDSSELPTYQFVSGVATTSLAQRTAARLGVTRTELLELIRQNGQRPRFVRGGSDHEGNSGQTENSAHLPSSADVRLLQ